MFRHGNAKRGGMTPEYKTWRAMLTRCRNPRNPYFADYGGRGIVVCERWKEFGNFLADMGPRPLGASIDRIDNDGNYEPGNCRWATVREQQRNRRSNVWVEINGVRKIAEDWAIELGINARRFRERMRRGGMSPEEALVNADLRKSRASR
jgi:hypothetical protein